ncbi:MAG: hypothetical protein WC333_02255 [Dehalococcoidia bacterium]|jgi:hypothetical protein
MRSTQSPEFFIKNKLRKIQTVAEKNLLNYVCIYSGIDENFGRVYIRWYIEIGLLEGRSFEYDFDKYLSYNIWHKDENRYELTKKEPWEVRNKYSETFFEYYIDIRRFCELLFAYVPNVEFYQFISKFDFHIDKKFGNITILESKPESISIIKNVNENFKVYNILHPTQEEIEKASANDDEKRFELLDHLEHANFCYENYKKLTEKTS